MKLILGLYFLLQFKTNMIFLIEVQKLLNSSPIFYPFFLVNEYAMSSIWLFLFFLFH